MIEIGHHVQQMLIAVLHRPAVTEKGSVDVLAINRKRLVLGAVRPHPAAVLVDILIAGRLIHVPDAAVSVRFAVQSQ